MTKNFYIFSFQLTLYAIFSSSGCWDNSDVKQATQTNDRKAPPLRVSLEREGDQSSESIRLKLTVTNQSDQPVQWDRMFSVFLDWSFRTAEGASIKAEQLSVVPFRNYQTTDRFVTLEPGASIATVIEPTSGMMVFNSGRSSEETPTAFETYVRYPIPMESRMVQVGVRYVVFARDVDGFRVLFKANAADIGLPLKSSEPYSLMLFLK